MVQAALVGREPLQQGGMPAGTLLAPLAMVVTAVVWAVVTTAWQKRVARTGTAIRAYLWSWLAYGPCLAIGAMAMRLLANASAPSQSLAVIFGLVGIASLGVGLLLAARVSVAGTPLLRALVRPPVGVDAASVRGAFGWGPLFLLALGTWMCTYALLMLALASAAL